MVDYTDRGGLTAADCARDAGFTEVASYLDAHTPTAQSLSPDDSGGGLPHAPLAGDVSPGPPSTEMSSGMQEVQPRDIATPGAPRQRDSTRPVVLGNNEEGTDTDVSHVDEYSAAAAAAMADTNHGDDDDDGSEEQSISSFHIDDDDEEQEGADGGAPKIDVRKAFGVQQQQQQLDATSPSGGRTAPVSGSLDFSESSDTTVDVEPPDEV